VYRTSYEAPHYAVFSILPPLPILSSAACVLPLVRDKDFHHNFPSILMRIVQKAVPKTS